MGVVCWWFELELMFVSKYLLEKHKLTVFISSDKFTAVVKLLHDMIESSDEETDPGVMLT